MASSETTCGSIFGKCWSGGMHRMSKRWSRRKATLPHGYEEKTAEQKLEVLWTNVTNAKHAWDNLPTETYSVEEFLDGLSDTTSNIVPLFTRLSDEMPSARKKFMSTYGVICKVRMVILPNSTYTGLFQPGEVTGLLRLTLAAYSPPPHKQYSPSLTFKFLIDGHPSENVFALHSVDGHSTSDRNWFLNELSNILPASPPAIYPKNITHDNFVAALEQLPVEGADKLESTNNLAVYEPASITVTGEKVTGVRAPYMITFWPNHHFDTDVNSTRDFRLELKDIPSGSMLYTITAQPTKDSTDTEVIGEIHTTSAMVSSTYADELLMFRHPIHRWKKPGPPIPLAPISS